MSTIPAAPATLECLVRWAEPADTPALHALLAPAELDRRERFRLPADRARFVAGRALARRMLSELTGLPARDLPIVADCAHCGGPHGKPRLPGYPFSFSVSHSGDRVVVAVACGAEIGVDVERHRPGAARLARRILAPAEQAVIAALPAAEQDRAVRVYWVRKEAILKATGHGLAAPMAGIVVGPPSAAAALLSWDGLSVGLPGTATPAPVTASLPPASVPVQLADLNVGTSYAAALAALTHASLTITGQPGLNL